MEVSAVLRAVVGGFGIIVGASTAHSLYIVWLFWAVGSSGRASCCSGGLRENTGALLRCQSRIPVVFMYT